MLQSRRPAGAEVRVAELDSATYAATPSQTCSSSINFGPALRGSMEKRRQIVICGNTVIMGALRASLLRSGRYEVISLPQSEQDKLAALKPDVVLFDRDAGGPEAVFSLLDSRDDLLLIGVRPNSSVAMVWSGRPVREISTQDLINLIDRGEPGSTDRPKKTVPAKNSIRAESKAHENVRQPVPSHHTAIPRQTCRPAGFPPKRCPRGGSHPS